MKRTKYKYICIILSLTVFFSQAVYSTISQGRKTYKTLKKFYNLSDNQKRDCLIGDLYRFATKFNKIVPENSNILFLSNILNNQSNYDLFLNYYLYPRKLFWLNNVSPYPESPPEIGDLDHNLISERKIDWVIFRYPKGYGLNKVVKLSKGKVIKSFRMD